jgi:hypothetical protein
MERLSALPFLLNAPAAWPVADISILPDDIVVNPADPTPHDACAFRVVNPLLAPAGYAKSLTATSGCTGH